VVRMDSISPSAAVSVDEDDDDDDDDDDGEGGLVVVCDDDAVDDGFAVMGSTSSASDSATIRWAVEKNLDPG